MVEYNVIPLLIDKMQDFVNADKKYTFPITHEGI